MSDIVRVPVDMEKELREKAKKYSKKLFGQANVSLFIRTLIKNYKPEENDSH